MDDVINAVTTNAAPVLVVLVVALVAYVALRIVGRLVSRVVLRRMRDDEDPSQGDTERRRRLATITSLVDWIFRVLIVGAAVAAVLVIFNLTPVIVVIVVLLAVAAVVARDVIRDYVGGFLIVAENQFSIGDWVEAAGQYGEVEHLSLRRTVLRSMGGDAVMIPNGDIRTVVNRTRGWARINIELRVGDPSLVAAARAAIKEASDALIAKDKFASAVMEPPHLEMINDITDADVRLLIWGKVKASDRFRVESEYRSLLLGSLARHGVNPVIPQPIEIVGGPTTSQVTSREGE